MQLSTEQTAILEFVENAMAMAKKVEGAKKNLIINACAGSGKTTISALAISKMKGSILALAFGKKNAVQFADKLASMSLVNAKASTFHKEGLFQYSLAVPSVRLDKKKVANIAFKHCDTQELSTAVYTIVDIVSKAKQYCFGVPFEGCPSIDDTQAWIDIIEHHDIASPTGDVSREELIEISKAVLKESNRDKTHIDFDDMIYFPLLFKIQSRTYDCICVDEAQDTNIARKLIVKLWSKGFNPNLPLDQIVETFVFIVGDDMQAIMGFTGANNDSMEMLQSLFDCDSLPLTTCYRCGKNIIEEARKINPNIHAFEGNGDGDVSSIPYQKFLDGIRSTKLNREVGIICRNNAPIVSLAFSIIRQGIGCRIEGKDIGENLKKLTYKWKKVKTLTEFIEKLTEYFQKEFDKAKSKIMMQMLEDKLETMIILIERCLEMGKNDLRSLQNLITSMFSNAEDGDVPDIVTLSSIHKAKGMEWQVCYILGESQLQPSKYAEQEWEKQQEQNLIYVARTRAIEKLVYITDIPLRGSRSGEG